MGIICMFGSVVCGFLKGDNALSKRGGFNVLGNPLEVEFEVAQFIIKVVSLFEMAFGDYSSFLTAQPSRKSLSLEICSNLLSVLFSLACERALPIAVL